MHLFIASLVLISSLFIFIFIKTKGVDRPFPVYLFLFFYFVTSFVGGIHFLYGGSEELSLNDHLGLDQFFLENINLFIYIVILFLPFIVVPFFYILFDKSLQNKTLFKNISFEFNVKDIVICYFSLVAIFILYNVASGSFSKFIDVLRAPSYGKFLSYREEVFSSLPVYIMSIVHIILPSLALSTLYLLSRNKTFKNCFFSLVLVGFSCLVSVITFQKAPLLVLFLMIAIFSVYLRIITMKFFVVIGIFSFTILYIFQSFVLTEWSMVDTIYLLIYRTAIAIPYYISIYPSFIGFQGPDMLFDGKSVSDNLEVFQYMYPLVGGDFGAIAAPDFIRSYAKGGIFYSLISLSYTSLVFALLGVYFKKIRGLFHFLLLCIFSYAIFYFTQTNWKDVIISSYGIVWSLLFLGFYLFIKRIFRKLCSN